MVKNPPAMQETQVQSLGWEDTPRESESESEVAQSCPTLCDPVDCSLPGSSIHGILQARILEWVTISFSRGSSQPRNRTGVSCIGGRRFNALSHQGTPGEGHANSLQYSCLENPVDRGAQQATVHGVTQSWTRLKQLSIHSLL